MATIKQTGSFNLNTDTPQIQTVTPKTSSTASNLQALTGVGDSLFRSHIAHSALNESEKVNEQLNSDLAAIDEGQDLGNELVRRMGEVAEADPRLRDLSRSLGAMKTAESQRKGAVLLHRLRGEAAMKSVAARAPGLRPEIARLVSTNLGFDPTGATINAILKGALADSSGASQREDWYDKQIATNLLSKGITPMMREDGHLDTAHNVAKLGEVQQLEARMSTLTASIESGEILEENQIAEYGQVYQQLMGNQLNGINSTILNILPTLSSQGDYATFKQQIIPQLATLETQLQQRIDTDFSSLNISGKSRAEMDRIRQQVKDSATSGLKAILESGNMTDFQVRAELFTSLQQDVGMNWTQANQTLALIADKMPGAIQSLYTAINVKDLDMRGQLVDMLKQGLTVDEKGVRALNLTNLVDVMVDREAFSNLNKKEKEAVARDSLRVVKDFTANFETRYHNPRDVDAVANAMASTLQLSSQFVASDWDEIARVTNDGLPRLIEVLEKGDTDAQMKANILADSGIEALQRYVSTSIMGSFIEQRNRNMGRDNASAIQYNMGTGQLLITREAPPTIWGGIKSLAGGSSATRDTTRLVDELNKTVNTLHSLSKYDPQLEGMTKPQIMFSLIGRDMVNAGFTPVGKAPEMPKATTETTAETTAVSLDELTQRLSRRVEDLKMSLQGSEGAEELRGLSSMLEDIVKEQNRLRAERVGINSLLEAL